MGFDLNLSCSSLGFGVRLDCAGNGGIVVSALESMRMWVSVHEHTT